MFLKFGHLQGVNHGDKMYKNHAQKMYNQPSIN